MKNFSRISGIAILAVIIVCAMANLVSCDLMPEGGNIIIINYHYTRSISVTITKDSKVFYSGMVIPPGGYEDFLVDENGTYTVTAEGLPSQTGTITSYHGSAEFEFYKDSPYASKHP